MSNTATVLAFDFGASSGRGIRAVYDGQNLTYEENIGVQGVQTR